MVLVDRLIKVEHCCTANPGTFDMQSLPALKYPDGFIWVDHEISRCSCRARASAAVPELGLVIVAHEPGANLQINRIQPITNPRGPLRPAN